MNEQDVARELALPGAQELLTGTAMAHIAYNGPEGFPRLIPIGFLWNGREIVVCTATTAPKVRGISARPQVAVTIDEGGTDGPRVLMIRGTATIDVVDGVADEYMEMSLKGIAPERLEEFQRNVRAMYPEMARIVITPEWARFLDYGAGRLPRFLQDLAEQSGWSPT